MPMLHAIPILHTMPILYAMLYAMPMLHTILILYAMLHAMLILHTMPMRHAMPMLHTMLNAMHGSDNKGNKRTGTGPFSNVALAPHDSERGHHHPLSVTWESLRRQ